MKKRAKARPRIQKPTWERAYKAHVLWLGKAKLGKVRLVAPGSYSWEAGGRRGAADDLDKAKRAVELAVAVADKQPDLFG